MKLRLLAASLAAVALSSGVALAQTAPAAQPQARPAPAPVPVDKTVLSYALGYELGSGVADETANIDINQVIKGLQEGFRKQQPSQPREKMGQQIGAFQQRRMAEARAEFEKEVREAEGKSTAFLAANRSKPGVVTLPSGIQYRIIEPGSGPRPSANGEAQVHFRATLADGREWQSTYRGPDAPPVTMKVAEAPLEGIAEILPLMPVGSRWEVFLPPAKAFGNDPRSPIGPGQVLVFDLKVVSAK